MEDLFISLSAINRVVAEKCASDRKYRKKFEKSGGMLLSQVRQLTEEQLLERLRNVNVEVDRQDFGASCRQYVSAEEMMREMISGRSHKQDDAERLWMSLEVLWELWCPDIPNMEMVEDRMQEGYQKSVNRHPQEASRIWLKVWNDVLQIMDRAHLRFLQEMDKRFPGYQSLFNWVQDFEEELWNAGIQDPQFYEERIRFCEECIRRLNGDGHEATIISGMRVAIGQSWSFLEEMDRSDALFQSWLKDNPKWGWGWIAWSDCHWLWRFSRASKDHVRAEQILKEALAVEDVKDKKDILFRLTDLYKETGRTAEVQTMMRELKKFVVEPSVPAEDFDPEDYEHHGPMKSRKIGRNEPCPCGSGKKYKRCCGS